MVEKRVFKDSNYKAFFFNGKTVRFAIDPSKPITELEYPEFFDVSITDKCLGQCEYCYQDSKPEGQHYKNIIEKVVDFFGPMTKNQRPYQVAIGGGEPTSHPDFVELLKTFYDFGIMPNYTTNGMDIPESVIVATEKYCGGVAVSCHPHLNPHWGYAASKFISSGVKLNFHIIISDRDSVDYFESIYYYWRRKVDHFVLLPYTPQGRATEKKDIDWEYLLKKMPGDTRKIAFGANFHSYLSQGGHGIQVSLYEPEIFSKYLSLKDMKIYKSSFDLEVPN